MQKKKKKDMDSDFVKKDTKQLTPEEQKKRDELEKKKLEPMTFNMFSVLSDEQRKKLGVK